MLRGLLVCIFLCSLALQGSAFQLSSGLPSSSASDGELVEYLALCAAIDPEYVTDIMVSQTRLALVNLENGLELPKACFLAPGEANDLGWSYQEFLAYNTLNYCFGAPTDIVPDQTQDSSNLTMVDLIENKGCNVIMGMSLDFSFTGDKLSLYYPDVSFIVSVPTEHLGTQPNLRAFDIHSYEGSYLMGYLAHFMSPTDTVGGVWTQLIVTELQAVNAYYFGLLDAAASVNEPPKKFSVWFTNSFGDTDQAVRSARDLVESHGAGLVSQTVDTYRPQVWLRNHDVYGTGVVSDMGAFAGPTTLGSLRLRWDVAGLIAYTNILVNGGSWGNTDLYVPASAWSGSIDYGTLSPLVPKDVQAKVDAIYQTMRATQYASGFIWCGDRVVPLLQPGQPLAPDGCMNFTQLYSINAVHPDIDYLGIYEIPLKEVPLSTGSRAAMYALSSVVLAFIFFTAGVMFYRQGSTIVRIASPIFCGCILLGAVVVVVGTFLLPGSQTDGTCRTWIPLFEMGFMVILSAIIAKSFRVWYVVKQADKFRTVALTPLTISGFLIAGVLVQLAFILAWRFADPPKVIKLRSCKWKDRDGCQDSLNKYQFMYVCDFSAASNAILLASVIVKFVLCAPCLYFTYYGGIRMKDALKESTQLMMTLVVVAIITLFGAMFIVLSYTNAVMLYWVIWAAVLIMVSAVVIFLFGFKLFYLLFRPNHEMCKPVGSVTPLSQRKSVFSTQGSGTSGTGHHSSGTAHHSSSSNKPGETA